MIPLSAHGFSFGSLMGGGSPAVALPAGAAERIRRRKPSILLACMPKSGSTYLTTLISLAAGYPPYSFVYAYDRNEQDLYLPALLHDLAALAPTVTHQHVRATGPNLELIQAFRLRTIVLVRNLFDAAVSLHDHFLQEDVKAPCAYIPADFARRSLKQRLDLIVDLAIPWYLGFYASWFEVRQKRAWPAHWVSYGDLLAKPEETLAGILAFCEATPARPLAEVFRESRARNTRFNQGVEGRGEQMLDDGQKDRIRRLAAHYPTVDFSWVGLGKADVQGAANVNPAA